MRLLILAIAALSLMAPALAQENTTNTTAGNETAPANETSANDTPTDAPAEPAGPLVLEMEAVQDASGFYFRLKGQTAKNPAINVEPGQKVTITVTSVAGVHNLNINGETKTAFIADGESATLEWTAPADAKRLEYWCDPHKSSGMKGAIQVGAPSGGETGGETGTITGDTVPVGCADLVAPAIVTTGIVGGPTFDDYKAKCPTSDTDVAAPDPYKSVDYVIPLSWALIGLGVVGVVWVHKYYKP